MKEPIIYKILLHLYEREAINEDAIDITDFLKTIWDENNSAEEFNNLNRINYAMNRILENGYGQFFFSPQYCTLNQAKTMPNGKTERCTPKNIAISARISTKGHDYIVDEMRKRQQDLLIANSIATNKSLQDVNASNSALNRQTQKYYSHLKWATWVIAGATIANVLVILLPLFFNKKPLTLSHSQAVLLKKESQVSSTDSAK